MSTVMKEVPKTEIAEFDEFAAKLHEFEKRYKDAVYDLTDPTQEKQARSDKYAIGKVISALDSKHKEIKAPLKERVDLIDGERKRIKDQLLEVQSRIKAQIEARDREIQAHEEALQAMIDEIRNLMVFQDDQTGLAFTPDSDEVKRRLAILGKIEVDDSFEHRKADGTLAQVETRKALDALLIEREKYEAEQAELERLRQEAEERERADREEKIRREAEERAAREAQERAERERKQAEEKAAREKAEAEAAHKRELEEAARKQREAEEAAKRAAQEERERIEREQEAAKRREEEERRKEEAKKARRRHREKIMAEAAESMAVVLMAYMDAEVATETVKAIAQGEIKHVIIEY